MGTQLARLGRFLRLVHEFFTPPPQQPRQPRRTGTSAEFAREAESQSIRSTFTGG